MSRSGKVAAIYTLVVVMLLSATIWTFAEEDSSGSSSVTSSDSQPSSVTSEPTSEPAESSVESSSSSETVSSQPTESSEDVYKRQVLSVFESIITSRGCLKAPARFLPYVRSQPVFPPTEESDLSLIHI